MIPPKSTALALALALVFCPAAFARKKPIDLSVFRGNYHGTSLWISGGQAVPGIASAVVSVPKSGRSAVISYQGTLSGDGESLTVQTTISLSKDGIFQISDAGLGILSSALPVSGYYQPRKGRFTIVIPAGGRTLTVTGNVTGAGKTRNLELDFRYDTTVGTFTINNTLTAKVK